MAQCPSVSYDNFIVNRPDTDMSYIVPLDIKGSICHFVKWQIHPFTSKVIDFFSESNVFKINARFLSIRLQCSWAVGPCKIQPRHLKILEKSILVGTLQRAAAKHGSAHPSPPHAVTRTTRLQWAIYRHRRLGSARDSELGRQRWIKATSRHCRRPDDGPTKSWRRPDGCPTTVRRRPDGRPKAAQRRPDGDRNVGWRF